MPTLIAAALVAILTFALALRRPMSGLVVLLFAEPFTPVAAVGHSTIDCAKAALVALLLALLVRGRLRFGARDRAVRPIAASLVALVACTALTIVEAQYPGAVLRETAKAIEYAGVALAAYCAARDDGDEAFFLRALWCVVGAVALGALSQEITGAPSVFRSGGLLVPRIAGALEGPNQLAGYLGLVIPVVFAHALAYGTRAARSAALCGCALLLVVAALTFSRGGMLATLVAVACVVGLSQGSRAAGVAAAVAGTLLGAIADLALAHGAGRLFAAGDPGATGGVGHRGELWRAALMFWRESPLLGIGAGNYERELGRAGMPQVHTHANSLYLQSLAEGGVVLFAATVATIVTVLRATARSLRENPWLLGVFAATVGFALHQIVDDLAFFPKVGATWWLLTGMALGSRARRAEPTTVSQTVKP